MDRVRLAWLRLAAIATDAALLAGAWVGAVHLRAGFHGWWPYDLVPDLQVLAPVHAGRALPLGLVVVPIWLAALHRVGSYEALRRKGALRIVSEVLTAAAGGLMAVLALLFLLRVEPASRTLLVGYALGSVPVILGSRLLQGRALAWLRQRAFDPHRVLLVGEAGPWLQAVQRQAGWGIEVREVSPSAFPEALLCGSVDEVYLAGNVGPELLELAGRLCDEIGVPLSIDANFLGLRMSRADLVHTDGWSVLTFSSPPSRAPDLVIKRVLDVCLASIGLISALPVLALAALAIRLDDGGPVFYVQERVGRFGRPFRMFKLRTMVVGADRWEDLPNDADGPVFKLRLDPRVTRVGRVLRRLSIDELPQLVNVIRGEMSLVGPRPPLPSEVTRYERWQLRRLSVRPGLTCSWQVSGRSDLPFDQWMALDLAYIDNWSLWLDLRLLLRTVPAVIRGTGAR